MEHTYFIDNFGVQTLSIGQTGDSQSLVFCGRDTAAIRRAQTNRFNQTIILHGEARLCRGGFAAFRLDAAEL